MWVYFGCDCQPLFNSRRETCNTCTSCHHLCMLTHFYRLCLISSKPACPVLCTQVDAEHNTSIWFLFSFFINLHFWAKRSYSLDWKQEKCKFSTEKQAEAAIIWTKNLAFFGPHTVVLHIIISWLTPQHSRSDVTYNLQWCQSTRIRPCWLFSSHCYFL